MMNHSLAIRPSRSNFLIQRASPRNKSSLTLLTNDTLVDHVFPYLSIRDLIRLRGVCRLLYELTHHPIIWKNILRNIHFPLPPLPPTSRYSFPSLSSFESERLIVRGLTLDANWRSELPKIYRGWAVPAYYDVLSMKILPGGQYMVASVRCSGHNKYALLLYMMDHRVKIVYPIAITQTSSKAYKINAKYMQYEGDLGIMVAYVRREPRHEKDRQANINVSEFSDEHDIDWPVSVRYEAVVLFSSLKVLEVLVDPRYPPGSKTYQENAQSSQAPPFRTVASLRSTSSYDFLDLDDVDGEPHVFVARKGNEITMKNLVSRAASILMIQPLDDPVLAPLEAWTFALKGIRVLPTQRQILIVRIADRAGGVPPTSRLTLEMYDMPEPGETVEAIAEDYKIHQEEARFGEVRISAHHIPSIWDQSVIPTLCQNTEPPPISVCAVVDYPWGIVHYRITPLRVPIIPQPEFILDADGHATEPPPPPVSETAFVYPLIRARVQCANVHGPRDKILHVLPGMTRTLFYSTPIDDRTAAPGLMDLYAYADMLPPTRTDARWPVDAERRGAAERERAWINKAYKQRDAQQLLVPLPFAGKVGKMFGKGMVTMAWDEWTGHILMVAKLEPQDVYVFEFSHSPEEDKLGNRLPLPVHDVDERFRLPVDDLYGDH